MNKIFELLFKICLFSTILSFNSSFADNISDFQIEGISLGDKALDYFSKLELNNSIDSRNYKNNEFKYYFLEYPKSKTYEFIQITVKPSDKSFEIYGIEGHMFYKNINQCHKKMEEIKIEIDNLLNIEGFTDSGEHYSDPSGKSTYKRYLYYLNEDRITIICYDMSKEFEKKGAKDRLAVGLDKSEFIEFLDRNY
jgi:hypothetical protein